MLEVVNFEINLVGLCGKNVNSFIEFVIEY